MEFGYFGGFQQFILQTTLFPCLLPALHGCVGPTGSFCRRPTELWRRQRPEPHETAYLTLPVSRRAA
jgi:hypothetical protein